jgi:hypothetical protein
MAVEHLARQASTHGHAMVVATVLWRLHASNAQETCNVACDADDVCAHLAPSSKDRLAGLGRQYGEPTWVRRHSTELEGKTRAR